MVRSAGMAGDRRGRRARGLCRLVDRQVGAMSGRIAVSAKKSRTLDGIVFDSAAEMRRYAELRMLEKAGNQGP